MRKGSPSEADLRMLDEYRRSFGEAYEKVVGTIREQLNLEPTGRPAKSTSSLIEKLHRESIRLSQVQDIAGCRLVASDILEQEYVVASLQGVWPDASAVDRRINPSYGYRAVHVITKISDKPIEIQVRSSLQHLWAVLSEKFSDAIDPAIKYGGGPAKVRIALDAVTKGVADLEAFKKNIIRIQEKDVDGSFKPKLEELRKDAVLMENQITDICNEAIALLEVTK